jgi:hypothetical protein
MHRLLLLVLLTLLLRPTFAQQRLAKAHQRLAKAHQQSDLTKVFRLSEAQTRILYERGLAAAQPDFFTQVVDSFPTAQLASQRRALPLGYYLQAYAQGSQLVYELRGETDREILVVDNQVDLALVVRDSLGQLLPQAQVALASRPLLFDQASQSYRWAGGGQSGLLAVTDQGRTTFHPLNQTFPYSSYRLQQGRWLARAGGRVLYGFPLGYILRPSRQLVADLKHASNVNTGLVGLLRSPFSEYVREERQDRRESQEEDQPRWTSYVATSQPRYRPSGDTLQLKARVLRQQGAAPTAAPLPCGWAAATTRRRSA